MRLGESELMRLRPKPAEIGPLARVLVNLNAPASATGAPMDTRELQP